MTPEIGTKLCRCRASWGSRAAEDSPTDPVVPSGRLHSLHGLSISEVLVPLCSGEVPTRPQKGQSFKAHGIPQKKEECRGREWGEMRLKYCLQEWTWLLHMLTHSSSDYLFKIGLNTPSWREGKQAPPHTHRSYSR